MTGLKLVEKSSEKPKPHESMTVNDTDLDSLVEFYDPKTQKKVHDTSYDAHLRAITGMYKFLDKLHEEKKMDFTKMDDKSATTLVKEYLKDYIGRIDAHPDLKTLFEGFDKLDPARQQQYLVHLGKTFLGDNPDQNYKFSLVNALYNAALTGGTKEDIVRSMMDSGVKYFRDDKRMVQTELKKRFTKLGLETKVKGAVIKALSKHKLFEPYEIEEGKQGQLDYILPEEAAKLVSTLASAHYTGSPVAEDELTEFGLKHRKKVYEPRKTEYRREAA